MTRGVVLVACVCIACSSSRDQPDASAPDASTSDAYRPQAARCTRDAGAPPKLIADLDAAFDAAHPRAPQEIDFGGGVIALPTLVAVTYDEDTYRNEEEDFVASVGCTDYWRTVTSDYGVGQAVAGAPVHLSQSAPLSVTEADVRALVSSLATQPDGQTLYVIFYPAKTTIHAFGLTSCKQFGGYHDGDTTDGGLAVPWAVIPHCTFFGALAGIDAITAIASHELVESVTDPTRNPAYAAPEPSGYATLVAGGGEVGDLCEFSADAWFVPAGYPFYVQRSWSNSAAFSFADPCQPAPASPYFAAAPSFTTQVTVDAGLGAQIAKGVQLAVGDSTTIDVVAFANGPASPWTLSVVDAAKLGGNLQELDLALDQTTAKDGDVVHLTITRIRPAAAGFSGFALMSTSGSHTSIFWGLVL